MDTGFRRAIFPWAAAMMFVTQVGCAAGFPARPATELGAGRHSEACEAYAKAEANAAEPVPLDLPATKRMLGGAHPGALVATSGVSAVLLFVAAPVLYYEAAVLAVKDYRARGRVREEALRACLEPDALAAWLGPEHPEVAESRERLARLRADLEERQAERRREQEALSSGRAQVRWTQEGPAVPTLP